MRFLYEPRHPADRDAARHAELRALRGSWGRHLRDAALAGRAGSGAVASCFGLAPASHGCARRPRFNSFGFQSSRASDGAASVEPQRFARRRTASSTFRCRPSRSGGSCPPTCDNRASYRSSDRAAFVRRVGFVLTRDNHLRYASQPCCSLDPRRCSSATGPSWKSAGRNWWDFWSLMVC